MRIVGEWWLCTDAETRPVVEGFIATATGANRHEQFLVDTGADRTALTAGVLASLGLPSSAPSGGTALAGVGGRPGFVVVHTTLTLFADDGSAARFQGDFAAFTDPAAADMSILGREILDHFDLIVSRRRGEVFLLAQNHSYRIDPP
jgi:hypothetical protein